MSYRWTEYDIEHLTQAKAAPAAKRKSRRLAVTEHQHQVAVFQWAELMKHRWPCLEFMYAVPNGESRPWMKVTKKDGAELRISPVAKRLKAEGVKSGVPDIFLPAARGAFHGCYIEMKAGDNITSDNQDAYMAYLAGAGYFCVVAWSAEEAIASITKYLTESLPRQRL